MTRILVFDSGLGGLSVELELRKALPDAQIVYLADQAVFPYGDIAETELVGRILRLMDVALAAFPCDLAVIACNTASTIALEALRYRFATPFVGTVPGIKPAAQTTRSRVIGVLATPATVEREYTRALIDTYASHCRVKLVGAASLAAIAEACLLGEAADEDRLRAEIAPAFVEEGGARTDVVVLGCTHYPLIADLIAANAPWPVTYVDPAPAIARRAAALLGRDLDEVADRGGETVAGLFVTTRRDPPPAPLLDMLARRNLAFGALLGADTV